MRKQKMMNWMTRMMMMKTKWMSEAADVWGFLNTPLEKGQPAYADFFNTPLAKGQPTFGDLQPTYVDFLNTP